jgi:N-acetylmuramoyl-L-alanine amidase
MQETTKKVRCNSIAVHYFNKHSYIVPMEMKRRFFIRSAAVLSLAGMRPGSFFQLFGQTNNQSINLVNGSTTLKTELIFKNGLQYINAEDIATLLNARTYYNGEKRKFVFKFENQRVTVTANNAFVILNSVPYQLMFASFSLNDKIYVPLQEMIGFLSDYSPITLRYSASEKTLSVVFSDANVTAIDISRKSNGTLIRLSASEPFLKRGLTTSIRNGWLHVDIFGGKIDEKSIRKSPTSGIVSKIEAFQYKESCSIAFKLREKLAYHGVSQDETSNMILVSLRTDEDLKQKVNEETKDDLTEARKKWMIDTIILDPGHGGKDPGALGPSKKYREKDVVLAIGKYLRSEIQQNIKGVRVLMTRSTDVFIPLKKRTHFANEKNGKLFISLHANSNLKRSIGGFETYILGDAKDERAKAVALKENSVIEFEEGSSKKSYEGINLILATMAQSAFMKQSQYLAAIIQDEMDARLSAYKIKNRGVKQGPFWVMVGASMPNVLVEAAFISNRKEAKLLYKKSVQKQIAEAIYAGVAKYKDDIERSI